jgi:hypothetical protein
VLTKVGDASLVDEREPFQTADRFHYLSGHCFVLTVKLGKDRSGDLQD